MIFVMKSANAVGREVRIAVSAKMKTVVLAPDEKTRTPQAATAMAAPPNPGYDLDVGRTDHVDGHLEVTGPSR